MHTVVGRFVLSYVARGEGRGARADGGAGTHEAWAARPMSTSPPLDLSLMAVFVFGCLFKLIVCLIEISPYHVDIVADLEIVWIGFLGLGR